MNSTPFTFLKLISVSHTRHPWQPMMFKPHPSGRKCFVKLASIDKCPIFGQKTTTEIKHIICIYAYNITISLWYHYIYIYLVLYVVHRIYNRMVEVMQNPQKPLPHHGWPWHLCSLCLVFLAKKKIQILNQYVISMICVNKLENNVYIYIS